MAGRESKLHKTRVAAGLGLVCGALWAATGLAQTFRFTSSESISLSNNVVAATPYPAVIDVGTNGAASVPGVIQAVTVELNIFTCQVPEDVSVLLVGPNGTTLELMSDPGTTVPVSEGNLTFTDSASSFIPRSPFGPGNYKPTSYYCGGSDTNKYPSPAPQVFNAAPTCGTSTFANEFAFTSANGTWQLFVANRPLGTSASAISWSLNVTVNPPLLSATCTHVGNFCQGETGAQYTVLVSNAGPGPTGGSVPAMVVDTFPTGLTPIAASGSGWNCVISNQTATCIQTNQTVANTSYPPITLSVDVALNAAANLTNNVAFSGSSNGTNFTLDPTVIDPPGVTCPSNITVTASGYCPVVVNYNPSLSGNCGLSSLVESPPSGSAFAVGSHTVTVAAVDGTGQTNSCSFTVTVLPGPAPRLSASLAGTNVVLSWPANAGCYALQFAPELRPGSSGLWTTYAGPYATNGSSILVTNGVSAGSQFYRLAY